MERHAYRRDNGCSDYIDRRNAAHGDLLSHSVTVNLDRYGSGASSYFGLTNCDYKRYGGTADDHAARELIGAAHAGLPLFRHANDECCRRDVHSRERLPEYYPANHSRLLTPINYHGWQI